MLYKEHEFVNYMLRRRVTASWWNTLIANPMVIRDKSEAPLVIWGIPTRRPELTDEGAMRCTGANVEEIYALPIDVDNGTTMEAFEKDFHRYAYQLYTTHSWHNGKPGDRFRVFFPLKEPIKVRWLVPPVKEILRGMFDMADSCCFDMGHWQKLPCIGARDADYRYVQHDGERLSFARDNFGDIAREYRESAHWKREIAEADRDPRDNHDGAIRWVQKVLDETQEGARNRTSFSKLMWLKDTVGATYGEVLALRAPAGFEDEFAKMIERIYGNR